MNCRPKGRIEVTFRLFQDQPHKRNKTGQNQELSAGKYLFTQHVPATVQHKMCLSGWIGLYAFTNHKKPGYHLCIKKERTVNNDNTVQFSGQGIQLPPSEQSSSLSLSKKKVDVCLLEDNRIFAVYKTTILIESKLQKITKPSKKNLRLRTYSIKEHTSLRRKTIFKLRSGNILFCITDYLSIYDCTCAVFLKLKIISISK